MHSRVASHTLADFTSPLTLFFQFISSSCFLITCATEAMAQSPSSAFQQFLTGNLWMSAILEKSGLPSVFWCKGNCDGSPGFFNLKELPKDSSWVGEEGEERGAVLQRSCPKGLRFQSDSKVLLLGSGLRQEEISVLLLGRWSPLQL